MRHSPAYPHKCTDFRDRDDNPMPQPDGVCVSRVTPHMEPEKFARFHRAFRAVLCAHHRRPLNPPLRCVGTAVVDGTLGIVWRPTRAAFNDRLRFARERERLERTLTPLIQQAIADVEALTC